MRVIELLQFQAMQILYNEIRIWNISPECSQTHLSSLQSFYCFSKGALESESFETEYFPSPSCQSEEQVIIRLWWWDIWRQSRSESQGTTEKAQGTWTFLSTRESVSWISDVPAEELTDLTIILIVCLGYKWAEHSDRIYHISNHHQILGTGHDSPR